MDFDDLFADETLPVGNFARGRFQPKAKPRHKKETTSPVDVTDGGSRSSDLVGVSLPSSEVVGTIEPLKEKEGTEHDHSEGTASHGFGHLNLSFHKAAGQNADVFADLERLNDFTSKHTNQTDGDETAAEGQTSENVAASTVCDAPQSQSCPDLLITQDPVPCKEATASNNAGDGPFDDGTLEIEVEQERTFRDLNCLDVMSEATVASGWCAGKYKPKPKVQAQNQKSSSSLPYAAGVESVMNLPKAHFISSVTGCMPEGAVPVFPPDDDFDYSSIDLGDIIPPDPATSEFSLNEELTNLAKTHTDTASCQDVQQEDVPVMHENQISDKSHLAGKETEGGKSSSKLGKQVVGELIDEPDNGAHYNDSFLGEPRGSTIDGDAADLVTVDNASQSKRAPRKSKKPRTENEKPIRKRKKANEASDKSNKEPPKKFSHSTRRRRTVSKELLETPEDEIDPRKVPMKDLILLAEYKERLASKEAKASNTPLTNESAENSIHEERYHNEEETFASEEGNGHSGDQSMPRVQSSSVYLNYQSFMKKTPTIRWSKQETELFYEAIRQFGTDLSMIQQLFPGRTRQQVKLKYKKEERKHPLRLSEALTNRAKDHSHFKKVIEQLQEVAAQATQDARTDNSVDLTGDEDEELNNELNDKAQKVEQDQDGEADVGEVHGPLKDDEVDGDEEEEDDDDIWNSYQVEF